MPSQKRVKKHPVQSSTASSGKRQKRAKKLHPKPPSRDTMSLKKREKRAKKLHTEPSPLGNFFAKFSPRFKYNTSSSASLEFYRLCDESSWDRDDPERKLAHQEFKDALVQQFNNLYGTDKDNLADWQNLCYIIHIQPIPEGLAACREAVGKTHVNLVDLVDTHATGQGVWVFDSELDLSEYTQLTGKYFPKENAYAGGLLRYLLRHILNPAPNVSARRGQKRRR